MSPTHQAGTTARTMDGGAPRDIEVRYYVELLWRSRILLAAAALGGLALGVLVGRAADARATGRARCCR